MNAKEWNEKYEIGQRIVVESCGGFWESKTASKAYTRKDRVRIRVLYEDSKHHPTTLTWDLKYIFVPVE